MYDRFERRIHYLRMSVTDRCNLRCIYCRPEEGIERVEREAILSLEEMFEVARVGVSMGIDKIRLTGGEPLVRKGVTDLVERLAGLDGIKDLAMTTNGVLLPEYARALKAAGLDRVNISLDSLEADRFRTITRCGELQQVLDGIQAADEAGLHPIKLNCVIEESSDEPDALAVRAFAEEHGYQARFIRRMDLAAGQFWIVEGGSGGDCARCGRLRLSSRGFLVPCLFSDLGFSVREFGIKGAFEKALAAKPKTGRHSRYNSFYSLGG